MEKITASFNSFISRIDAFAFVPTFRTSKHQRGMPTCCGILATLVILIITVMNLVIRTELLINNGKTINAEIINLDAIEPKKTFDFVIGSSEPSTGYNMQIAFGIYNNYNFDVPVDLPRLGTLRTYLFQMKSSASGGITTSYKNLTSHVCDNRDVGLFNALGGY